MVTVKFFASLREDVGHDHLVLAADNVTELRVALSKQLPGGAKQALWADGVRLAVNQQFLGSDWRESSEDLSPSAELAFLPPVTGG
jgi:molybdopterin converting factor small subunit